MLLFENMEQIDITAKLEDFYRHLSEPDVDRTIFSAKFGDGKTVFLNQFRETVMSMTFIHCTLSTIRLRLMSK